MEEHQNNNPYQPLTNDNGEAKNNLEHLPDYDNEFNEKFTNQMRLGFIRKVYGILTTQLGLTFIMILLTMASESFYTFQKNNTAVLLLCVVFSLVSIICLACFKSLSRNVPTNYILLGIFTFCEAYIVSFICGQYNGRFVFMAGLMTITVVTGLTIYACTTEKDFTVYYAVLLVISLVFMVFGFLFIFTNSKTLHLIYAAFGVLLFSFYLIVDTQLIMGKCGLKYSMEDYIIASIDLYLDIINIFLYILQILGSKD